MVRSIKLQKTVELAADSGRWVVDTRFNTELFNDVAIVENFVSKINTKYFLRVRFDLFQTDSYRKGMF
jgi:hypothetical protein